jgi:hypothetical protein
MSRPQHGHEQALSQAEHENLFALLRDANMARGT